MKKVMSILLIGLLSACGNQSNPPAAPVPKSQSTQPAASAPESQPTVSAPSKMHFSADELFDLDSAIVKHGSLSRDQLDEFAIRLKTLTFDTVNVIGYTDRLGSEEHNMSLSLQRAEAVKSYLVAQGVDPGKIRTEGRGSTNSITGDKCKGHEKTEALVACLQPDRRVIVEVDGTR